MNLRVESHSVVSMLVVLLIVLSSVVAVVKPKTAAAAAAARERNSSHVSTEAYCDLELNCKGDLSDMPSSMKLPIRGAKGPPGSHGTKGEKGEDGAPGLPGMSGVSPPPPAKVAFFVGLGGHFGPVLVHTRVVFDRIITNVGAGYDAETGQFRSPVNGTYQFNVVVSAPGKQKAAVMLVKNGEMVATVWAESFPLWSTSSNTAILTLERDDLVWLMTLSKASHLYGYMYTTFSGFLIFEN